jgi:hypothetical protein
MLRGLALLCAALLCACSFMFTDKVHRDWQPSVPPRCKPSIISPSLDAIPPAVAIVAVASGELTKDIDVGGDQFKETVAAFALLAASPWLVSSIYGFYHRSKCRDAHRKHRQFRSNATGAPSTPN